jgi:hypothetical protein
VNAVAPGVIKTAMHRGETHAQLAKCMSKLTSDCRPDLRQFLGGTEPVESRHQ